MWCVHVNQHEDMYRLNLNKPRVSDTENDVTEGIILSFSVSNGMGLLTPCRAGGRAQGIATHICCVLQSKAARVFPHFTAGKSAEGRWRF